MRDLHKVGRSLVSVLRIQTPNQTKEPKVQGKITRQGRGRLQGDGVDGHSSRARVMGC